MTAPGPLDKTFTAALHKSPAKGAGPAPQLVHATR